MTLINKFDAQSIETISRIIGSIMTGSTITKMLEQLNIEDNSNRSTKWRRLDFVMRETQTTYDCGNKVLEIIKYVFHPTSSWFSDNNEYKASINEINKCISFYGYEVHEDGDIHLIKSSKTRTQANERYDLLKSKLIERNIHPKILEFCTQDIVNEDYFSIIFEASKSVYDRIRKMTSINLDGNRLIYTCFDLKYPIIVFNSLKTDTEKNLYSGLKNILLSIAQIGRNPKAHTPKIYSYDSLDNCLDILNLISFSHKMLDQCSINQFALDEFMKSN